ncbi:glycoside hydrolase family 2 protein [Terracidiphilus gabretensis]|uniref:glycoside hydrolase family 2 protein n=1 Tax=Terracidiphilus gabretensis TaxID=1577687 RepID=UPI00071C1BEF|nr:glycoside hydrolase family 2 TIM barrel-domain containing protein [Terracidiphilus gabretensis]
MPSSRFPLGRIALACATLICCGVAAWSQAANAPLAFTGADRRPALSLNGDWAYIVDPYFSGLFSFHHEEKKNGWFLNRKAQPGDTGPTEYDFDKAPKLKVPGDWNTQRESLFFYEGPIWYQRNFTYQPQAHSRVYLHVGAANYHSWWWVNGKRACEHEGGFTAFNCDVTEAVHAGDNFIVAAVDNTRREDNVPTLETDWWNYGGITREISLITVPNTFIDQYDLHLSPTEDGVIEGWAHLTGASAGAPVEVEIPELHAKAHATTNANGKAAIHFSVSGLERWSPEHPKLYAVTLHADADSINEQMGFRTIETRGTQILLNGKPVFLRGISIHAEAPYRTGRAWSDKDAETLLGWAKDLGCNFVRLAHYPHDETMQRAADRMGIMVWSENPVYWALKFDSPQVYDKASHQLEEEIGTLRNHASIILWSMANETPNNPTRTDFITRLAAKARELDNSRLITAALLVHAQGNTKIVDDPLGNVLDVIGVNEYIGWYEAHPETADVTQWDIRYDKPLIVSEFGGDAKAGLHGRDNDRWTEEYQANIYRHQIGMLNRIPQLRGMSPWLLMDFRSPNRPLAGIQDEFNRKGLISDQGEKKQAYYILQKAYKEGAVGKPE